MQVDNAHVNIRLKCRIYAFKRQTDLSAFSTTSFTTCFDDLKINLKLHMEKLNVADSKFVSEDKYPSKLNQMRRFVC